MLKEYALQPDLLSTWPVFRYLSDKFGYGRGRVISRFPKRWEKLVYDSLGSCMPVEKKKIVEGLIRLKPALYPRHYNWNNDKMWLDNAIEEHVQRPFCAIIARDNPNDIVDIIREVELDEKEPRWCAETQRHIERTATEMAACVEPILRYAREILFIDPHFKPHALRFKRPMEAFLQAVTRRPTTIPVKRIEIHTGHESNGTKKFFDSECVKHLPSIIPRGIQIRLIRWDQAYLHNRFILTEYGGLSFKTGLDHTCPLKVARLVQSPSAPPRDSGMTGSPAFAQTGLTGQNTLKWTAMLASTIMMEAYSRMILLLCWSRIHMPKLGKNINATAQISHSLKTT